MATAEILGSESVQVPEAALEGGVLIPVPDAPACAARTALASSGLEIDWVTELAEEEAAHPTRFAALVDFAHSSVTGQEALHRNLAVFENTGTYFSFMSEQYSQLNTVSDSFLSEEERTARAEFGRTVLDERRRLRDARWLADQACDDLARAMAQVCRLGVDQTRPVSSFVSLFGETWEMPGDYVVRIAPVPVVLGRVDNMFTHSRYLNGGNSPRPGRDTHAATKHAGPEDMYKLLELLGRLQTI